MTASIEDVLIEEALLLISRLERLSADSIWARRASGCRGNLLKMMDDAGIFSPMRGPGNPIDRERLISLMKTGYSILEKAAKDIALPNRRLNLRDFSER